MTTQTIQEEWKLTVVDRCDACGSRAYVQVTGITGDLLFCSHHYNKIMDDPIGYQKMMGFMLEVLDERDQLIENKSKGDDY